MKQRTERQLLEPKSHGERVAAVPEPPLHTDKGGTRSSVTAGTNVTFLTSAQLRAVLGARGFASPKQEVPQRALVELCRFQGIVTVTQDDLGPVSRVVEPSPSSGPRDHFDCAPRGGWRLSLSRFVTSDSFGHASTALVVINMVVMCCPYAGQTEEYAASIEGLGTVITLIFMLEMVLKLVGVGCTRYWRNQWNKLDGTIVIISGIDLGATIAFAGDDSNISFLRILRMLRVLRMLRLMRSWKGLYRICRTLFKALPQTGNMLVLFFLITLIFALLGEQLYGGSFRPPLEASSVERLEFEEEHRLPRTNFDYIGPAMLTVFIIMSGSWYDIMIDQQSASPGCEWFFVVVFVVGTYLLLNIFVAILLEQFAQDEEEDASGLHWQDAGTKQPKDGTELINAELAEALQKKSADDEQLRVNFSAEEWKAFDITGLHVKHFVLAGGVYFQPADDKDKVLREGDADEHSELAAGHGRSLGLFRRDGCTRRLCTAVVAHPAFDWLIIGFIVASSICLAIDSPRLDLTTNASLVWWLSELNLIFTIVFACEMVLKVVSMGLLCSRGAYLRDPWNMLDFFIVNISLLCLLADGIPQLRALRALRTLRVLRPLRLLSRDPGMRLIIAALFKVMPSVLNVFGVLLAMMTVFAILGLQLFMGGFGSCTDASIQLASECVEPGASTGAESPHRMLKGSSGDTMNQVDGVMWLNPTMGSFDSFGSAMLLLYIMSTGDGWEDAMYMGMNVVGPGLAPVRNDFSPNSLFFIAWMFIGGFFAINLFVGTICDNFSQMKVRPPLLSSPTCRFFAAPSPLLSASILLPIAPLLHTRRRRTARLR